MRNQVSKFLLHFVETTLKYGRQWVATWVLVRLILIYAATNRYTFLLILSIVLSYFQEWRLVWVLPLAAYLRR